MSYTIRVLSDGERLEDDVTFTDEQEHTAHARFDSTVQKYRRIDPVAPEITIQLFDAADDVVAEHTEVSDPVWDQTGRLVSPLAPSAAAQQQFQASASSHLSM